MGRLSRRQILVLALCPVAIAAGATAGVLSSHSGSGPTVNVSADGPNGGAADPAGAEAGIMPGDQSTPEPADPSTTATGPGSTTSTTAQPTTTTQPTAGTDATTPTGPSTTTTTTAPTTTTTTVPPAQPSVTFRAPVEVPAGTDAVAVAAGDFNGDHHPDLAVVDNGPAHQVVILTGDGKGSFAAGAAYPAPGPTAITTGDFNGDGRPDLAVLNAGSSSISILMGVGDGTFTPKPAIATGVEPLGILTADFTGDHVADLAVVTRNQTISVYPGAGAGAGDGTFSPAISTSVPGPTQAFAARDLNGDGKVDIAVGGDDTVYTLLGTGNGRFQTPVPHQASGSIQAVGIGDVNHDGRPDVVAVVPDLSAAYSFLGTPTGLGPASYQSIAGATPPGSGSSAALAVGDITGDHTDDVVISVATNKNVVLLLDNGTATLGHPLPNLTTGSGPLGLTLADVNGDGRADLVVADSSGGVAVFLAQGS